MLKYYINEKILKDNDSSSSDGQIRRVEFKLSSSKNFFNQMRFSSIRKEFSETPKRRKLTQTPSVKTKNLRLRKNSPPSFQTQFMKSAACSPKIRSSYTDIFYSKKKKKLENNKTISSRKKKKINHEIYVRKSTPKKLSRFQALRGSISRDTKMRSSYSHKLKFRSNTKLKKNNQIRGM